MNFASGTDGGTEAACGGTPPIDWLVKVPTDPTYVNVHHFHDTMRSASAAPCGILPSAKSFSIFAISAKLLEFLIKSCTLCFSLAVNCVLMPFCAAARPFTPVPETSNVLLLTPRIFAASSVGESIVPKSSVACTRSASRMRWKSRKRREGRRWIM